MALTQQQFMQLMGGKREPVTASLASVLDLIKKPLDYYAVDKRVPVVGGQSAADLIGLTGTQSLVQDFSQGKPMMRDGLPDERFIDAAGMIPMIKPAAVGAGQAAKYLGKEALRQGYEGTGLLGKIAPDMKMYAYLPDTPSKPNALVGTRFVSEAQGNLVPEVQIPIEKIKGASIVGTPYDNTPADTLIKQISDDITLDNPVYTMGGDNFARIISNYNNNIGGASNYGMASKMNNRFDVARKENLANKGTGEVYSATFNMSDEVPSEAFSSYPTDVITQIFNKNGDRKSTAAFNDWFRNSGVQIQKGGKTVLVRPFGNFKGIETPEGLAQLYTGEGFGAGGTAGNARKNLFKGASQTKFEKMFGYNMKDIRGAVNVPEFANLPKGYARGNLIEIPEKTILTPSSLGSKIKAYDTDTAGRYAGRINTTPIEILMPKTYNTIYAEMLKKYPKYDENNIKKMTLGAMEKRGSNISELVDNQVIDSYLQYHEGLLGK
jgi:hypothetical protein